MQNILIFVIAGVFSQEVIAVDKARPPVPAPAPRCTRSHEIYNSCGSACPATCDNYKTDIICTMQCVAGCFCEPEYVKNKDGNCVEPDECPQLSQEICTGSHEVYNTCGSACPGTCDNYNDNSFVCMDVCMEGCFCEPGYVKNSANICVLPTECPGIQPICIGSHEIYSTCGSACPATCDDMNGPPMPCITLCVEGCFCEQGYVKNSANICVLPSECPVTQPTCTLSHQVYTTCGSACPLTCENYLNPPTVCTRQCIIGCVCEPGYVKKADGSCCLPCECKNQVVVTEPQQPPCRANEVYSCGTLCPNTCATKGRVVKCKAGCQNGCFCASGYLRNSKNKCVPIKKCD